MKHVLISGCTRGIGAACVKKFLVNGWNVTGMGRSEENPFAEFEQMPTSFARPESDLPTKEEMKAADELANKLRDEMSLESILNEFGDGTD